MPPQHMGETLSSLKPVQAVRVDGSSESDPPTESSDEAEQVRSSPDDPGMCREEAGSDPEIPTTPKDRILPTSLPHSPLVSILRKPRPHWNKQSLNRCRVALIDIGKLGRKFWSVGEKYKRSKERPGVYLRVASRDKGRALLDYEFASKKSPNRLKVKFSDEVRLKFIRKHGVKKCAETHGEQMKDYPIWAEELRAMKMNVEYDSELEKTDSEESTVDSQSESGCATPTRLRAETPPLEDVSDGSVQESAPLLAPASNPTPSGSSQQISPPDRETWPVGKRHGKSCVRRLRWGKRRRNRSRRLPETRPNPSTPEKVVVDVKSTRSPLVDEKMEEIINLLSEVESLFATKQNSTQLEDRTSHPAAIPASRKREKCASSSSWDVDSEDEEERTRSFLPRSAADS